MSLQSKMCPSSELTSSPALIAAAVAAAMSSSVTSVVQFKTGDMRVSDMEPGRFRHP